jgi:transcriptional regulator of acetoin/glycerol metabolism
VAKGPFITVADLPEELRGGARDPADPHPSQSGHNWERERILAVLAEVNGNVAEAARRVGVSRMTMHRKIRKWSVSRLEVLNSARGRK